MLLTGTLESLRRQTQKRLDEGFAGLDSSEFLPSGRNMIGKSRAVGAGIANQTRFAAVIIPVMSAMLSASNLDSQVLVLGVDSDHMLMLPRISMMWLLAAVIEQGYAMKRGVPDATPAPGSSQPHA